jgi:hypothetical protein
LDQILVFLFSFFFFFFFFFFFSLLLLRLMNGRGPMHAHISLKTHPSFFFGPQGSLFRPQTVHVKETRIPDHFGIASRGHYQVVGYQYLVHIHFWDGVVPFRDSADADSAGHSMLSYHENGMSYQALGLESGVLSVDAHYNAPCAGADLHGRRRVHEQPPRRNDIPAAVLPMQIGKRYWERMPKEASD